MSATVELGPLVTITNVPLLEIGLTYPASTGPLTIDSVILASIIASQDDPNIPATRIKLGHDENPIDEDLQTLWDQVRDDANDSVPAVGSIANMHLSQDGLTLLGDLVGIPQWLADIMATAYPARSIEGGAWGPNVAKFETANQKDYPYTLHALALLGVAWPGCTSLADLQELFSVDGPEVTVIEMASTKPGGTPMPVKAQVNVEDVRRAFYEEVAQGDRYWWWDRAILLEPDEMIVTDPDAGQLYRLPFSVNGDNVTFSDPNPVKIVYEDTGPPEKTEEGAQASSVQLAALPNLGKVVARNRTRAEAYEGFRSTDDKEDTLDPKEIRKSVGLAEDASDEELQARLAELQAKADEPEPEPVEEPEEPEVEEPEAAKPEPVAAGTRTLDDDTYQRLMRGAETAEKMAAEQAKTDRDSTIAAAVQEGKFAPSRKDHWTKLWDADPEGTKATIAQLSAGVIPVGERGTSKPGEATAEAGGDAYPTNWLNQRERDKVEAAADGKPLRNPRVMVEA
jgi:hypothetical protein